VRPPRDCRLSRGTFTTCGGSASNISRSAGPAPAGISWRRGELASTLHSAASKKKIHAYSRRMPSASCARRIEPAGVHPESVRPVVRRCAATGVQAEPRSIALLGLRCDHAARPRRKPRRRLRRSSADFDPHLDGDLSGSTGDWLASGCFRPDWTSDHAHPTKCARREGLCPRRCFHVPKFVRCKSF